MMALTPAEKMARLRANRKLRGECTRCGAQPAEERTVCKPCNEYAKRCVADSRAPKARPPLDR
jgi:hypothetical protein